MMYLLLIDDEMIMIDSDIDYDVYLDDIHKYNYHQNNNHDHYDKNS